MKEDALRRVDLNLLVVFATVMREGSTTAAAKRLFLTQSAISQSLRRLRITLGDQLFVRDGSGIVPTERAKELNAQLSPKLSAIADVLTTPPSFDPYTSTRTFHVRIRSVQCAALMPALHARIQQCAPNLGVMINVQDTDLTDTALLDRGECDALIAPRGIEMESWHCRYDFVPAPFVCVFDGKRLGIDAPISIERYLALSHVIPPFEYGGKTTVDIDLRKAGLNREHTILTDDFAALPVYLKTLEAVAVLPKHAAIAFARLMDLTVSDLPLADLRPYRGSLYWHKRNDESAGHMWLRSLIMVTMEDLDRSPGVLRTEQ